MSYDHRPLTFLSPCVRLLQEKRFSKTLKWWQRVISNITCCLSTKALFSMASGIPYFHGSPGLKFLSSCQNMIQNADINEDAKCRKIMEWNLSKPDSSIMSVSIHFNLSKPDPSIMSVSIHFNLCKPDSSIMSVSIHFKPV